MEPQPDHCYCWLCCYILDDALIDVLLLSFAHPHGSQDDFPCTNTFDEAEFGKTVSLSLDFPISSQN